VIVDEQDQVRLIDFGIAKPFRSDRRADTVQLGTIGFAAPEQFQSARTDRRTDLFTLGAVMYYLLSGGSYYFAARMPITAFRNDLPPSLVGLVDRLLRTDPNERVQTAEEVVDVLAALEYEASVVVGDRDDTLADSNPAVRLAQSQITPMLIIVGSLYPGAGATMVGTSLARALHRRKLPHAYVEYPNNPPDLYRLLYGEKRAPRHYRFCDEVILCETGLPAYRRWTEGATEWVPASPEGLPRPWELKDSRRLLRLVDAPLALVDISDAWRDEAVNALCRQADAILVVTDSNPSKMYRPQVARIIETLVELRNGEIPLHLVTNRDLPLKGRNQWLSSLFISPTCCFPELDASRVVQCQWQGKLCADEREFLDMIDGSLDPLLRSLPLLDLAGGVTITRVE
jgi:serine/threonine-protein kinase